MIVGNTTTLTKGRKPVTAPHVFYDEYYALISSLKSVNMVWEKKKKSVLTALSHNYQNKYLRKGRIQIP